MKLPYLGYSHPASGTANVILRYDQLQCEISTWEFGVVQFVAQGPTYLCRVLAFESDARLCGQLAVR